MTTEMNNPDAIILPTSFKEMLEKKGKTHDDVKHVAAIYFVDYGDPTSWLRGVYYSPTLPPDTLQKDVPPLYTVVRQMIEDADDDPESDRREMEEALKNFESTFNPTSSRKH